MRHNFCHLHTDLIHTSCGRRCNGGGGGGGGRLYGGDGYMRIRQETVLGFGAWEIMQALGETVHVYHLNEGHCAFVALRLLAEAKQRG